MFNLFYKFTLFFFFFPECSIQTLKYLNQIFMMIIPKISPFFHYGYLLVWQQEQKNFNCVIIKLRDPFDG